MTRVVKEQHLSDWTHEWDCQHCGSILQSDGSDVRILRRTESPRIICPVCGIPGQFSTDIGQIILGDRKIPGWVVQTAIRKGRYYIEL